MGVNDKTVSQWPTVELIISFNGMTVMAKIFFASFFFTFVAADECPQNITDLGYSAYDPKMGCLYADPSEEDMFDTYQKALDHCKKILGNDSVLVEVYSKEEQDLVVSLMVEAEKELMSPELSYWWSGLKDDDDDSGNGRTVDSQQTLLSGMMQQFQNLKADSIVCNFCLEQLLE